ncbi:MAG: hypothetical protein F7B59_06080 [Desulfurococcales archaeon]|nr:hypothetical protein [Desulfurococcales archaeon]
MYFDIDELSRLLASLFALLLFVISLIAYYRERRRRLLIISIAFLTYSVKVFLKVSDIFFAQKPDWVDHTVNFLDFIILFLFFTALWVRDRG